LLDLRTFDADKLPDDSILVPKHVVVVGTCYEVFSGLFLTAFKLAHFVGFKHTDLRCYVAARLSIRQPAIQ